MKTRFLLISALFFVFFSCSSNDDNDPKEQETANITAELLFFNHEVNTQDHTELLEYKIKFSNLSSFDIKGFPKIFLKSLNDPETTYAILYLEDEAPCNYLQAREDCTVSFSKRENYSTDITGPAGPAEIQIDHVEYIIVEELREP